MQQKDPEASRERWSRERLEYLHGRFRETSNPMYACQAYLETRSIGDSLPDWVLDYFDDSMSAFWRMWQGFATSQVVEGDQENRPAEAFAEAFQMKAPRGVKTGRGTVWTKFSDTKWIVLGGLVHSVIMEWEGD
jgi:hypothetical protein